MPFVVDVKKGFKLLTDPKMWHVRTKAEKQHDKRLVAGYKKEYGQSGSKDSYDSWVQKKGYAKKADTCTIM